MNKIEILINYYVFEILNFDLLIGHPLEKLVHEGQKAENLDVNLRKSVNLSYLLSRSAHSKVESRPKSNPIEEFMVASFLEPSYFYIAHDSSSKPLI
jgi:hypothetical protein